MKMMNGGRQWYWFPSLSTVVSRNLGPKSTISMTSTTLHWHQSSTKGFLMHCTHRISIMSLMNFTGIPHTKCYNFLPFSCILPHLCSPISLLPLCSFTWGDRPLLTCLPVILFPLYHSFLVLYLITGLSLPLTTFLMVVMFPRYSTKFYNLLLR